MLIHEPIQPRTNRQRQHSDQCGAAAVEFGLLLPVLLMILLGIMDYGFVYFSQLSLTAAAREAARVGVTRSNQGAATADAEGAATKYLNASGLTDAATTATIVTTGSDPAVQVNVSLAPFTPLIGFVPTPDSLNASATMRWEAAP